MHLLRTFLTLTIACAIWPGCASVSSRSLSFLPSSSSRGNSSFSETETADSAEPDQEAGNVAATESVEQSAALASHPPNRSPHDSATQMLIATELRDAPSSERQSWMAYINTLPAAEVPKALRERRLGAEPGVPRTIELEQQASAIARHRTETPAASEAGEPSIQQATAEAIPSATPGHTAAQHSLSNIDTNEQAPPHTQQVQSELRSQGTEADPQHSSLFPTWPDWDKSKFWHAPEANQRFRDRLPLPKIIAGGDHSGDSADQHAMVASESQYSSPTAEMLDRPIPSPDLRISPGATLWEDEIRKLIAMLEADAAATGAEGSSQQRQYVRQQVALRMLYLIAEDPQKAQRVIPQLPPSDQEFWTNVFLGLSTYLNNSDIEPMERKTQAIAQLRTAVHHLQDSARLQIRNLNFCHRIDGFGNYERFPQDVFAPGDAVLLYCELRNFHSEPTADGHYESKMRSSIQFIRQGDNLVADQAEFDSTTDLSRTVRTDYFHAHRLDLPQLAPGAYILKLRVEDELSGKIATESIPLTIR